MDNENKNENVEAQDEQATTQDDLREQIKSKLQEVRIQAMTTGAQTMMQLISSRIAKFEDEPGKHSCADYKRLVKSIKKMCTVKNDKTNENESPLLSVKTAEPLTRMINTGEGVDSDEQGSEDNN